MNMAINVITAISIALLMIGTASGQSSTSSSTTRSTTTTPATWLDPSSDGKYGNPGARSMVCKKSLDAIHSFASDMIGKAIQAMTVPDLPVNIPGMGSLVVKPPRVTEAQYGRHEYSMVWPNKIQSRFYEGHLAANGVWQYKPLYGDQMGGTYKATIEGAELNVTDVLSRGAEFKPQLTVDKCVANISNFRIEIQGHPDINVVEDCDLGICQYIKRHFETEICRLFEAFVKEVINRELQLVPSKMHINGDQYRVDYGLQNDEPKVNETTNCIQAGLEGKYMWRGYLGAPFNPAPMEWNNRDRMYSFHISDFTFNTMFHQAHLNGYRFSAADLTSMPSTTTASMSPSTIRQLLSMNCGQGPTPSPSPSTSTSTSKSTSTTPKSTTTSPSVRKFRVARTKGTTKPPTTTRSSRAMETKCLGSLFSNYSNFGPYSPEETGDIVFKTNRPGAIYIESDKTGFFDASSGVIEFYGPLAQSGYRPLLARADVRLMRGEFKPVLKKSNITGSIKLASLDLWQSSYLRTSAEWLETAGEFSKPMINEALAVFLDQFAQFPVPLPSKYECVSPTMSIFHRTVQLDCDVKQATCDASHTPCRCFRDSCVCSEPCKPKEEL